MTVVPTPGQQHETTAFEMLMAQGAVKLQRAEPTEVAPRRLIGDKGTAVARFANACATMACGSPSHAGATRTVQDLLIGTSTVRRNRVERLINRLKQYRRLATRYDKRAENYRAMWLIAATILAVVAYTL